VAANLQVGDEIFSSACLHEPAAATEIYIRKPSLRGADIYNAKISYAALPKPDRRSELFVRVQVVEGHSGIEAIHLPCAAIRDYFFAANRRAPWQSQTSVYYPDVALRLRPSGRGYKATICGLVSVPG